jgi:hypothetical protein
VSRQQLHDIGSERKETSQREGLLRRSLLRKIAPFWIMAVIVGSFMPYPFKREMGTTLVFTPSGGSLAEQVTLWHRVVHFLLFGSTAAILVLIGRSYIVRAAALVAVLSLAFSIEFTQNLIDHYGVEWWDVRDDFIGATLVFLVLLSPGLRRFLVRD